MTQDDDEVRRHQVNAHGAEPRKVIPAVLFTVGLLVLIVVVFVVITLVSSHH